MNRRKILQLTGAALAASVGTGNSVAGNGSHLTQEGNKPIEFDNSEELLLEPGLLPGEGWSRDEAGEGPILDAGALFYREFEGEEDSFWAVRSAAAGRDTETEAVDLYEELHADYRNRIGEARIMDLDLASEAVIAGYDGRTKAIFRDVNCVGSIGFADCSSFLGCLSHVDRTEKIARTKRQSWRGTVESPTESGEEQEDVESEPIATESGGEFVDEIDGQVTLTYGETARVSNGVGTTVYEGTLYDQMGDEVPNERDHFLVIPVEAQNNSDEPRTIPDQTDSWEVLFGDQQLTNVFRYGALREEGYTAFEGGDVQGRVRREGALLFEVDTGFEVGEFDVLWQDDWWVAADLDGYIDVRWSAIE